MTTMNVNTSTHAGTLYTCTCTTCTPTCVCSQCSVQTQLVMHASRMSEIKSSSKLEVIMKTRQFSKTPEFQWISQDGDIPRAAVWLASYPGSARGLSPAHASPRGAA